MPVLITTAADAGGTGATSRPTAAAPHHPPTPAGAGLVEARSQPLEKVSD